MKLDRKKKFGQHFLKDEHVLQDIIAIIPVGYAGPILEVGPGGGALTEYLLAYSQEHGNEYLAYEIDDQKVKYLQKKFSEHKDKFRLVDFLQAPRPWEEFLLIGNFPYNISSQILFRMIEWKDSVPMMIGMFQKEVADRIVSAPSRKSYGILSVIVQAFYDADYVMTIGPEAFDPPPKVESAMVLCTSNNDKFRIQDTQRFIKFVKMGFAQRRKTLRNNFKTILPAEDLNDDFFGRRAESLSVEEWVSFYFKYHENE